MNKPILQVALDLLNEHRALKIAEDSVKGGADWVEAGTPLIKSEGMKIIRKLKQNFPDKTIVADLKTMDTGALETEMASKAGADVVCILGAADDETIKEGVKSAHRYGSKIMVDLIGVKDKIKRASEVEKMGVEYLCVHIGIDEQMKGKKTLGVIKKIYQKTSIPVAAAGGINSETAADTIIAGAKIIIVGGAITKAKNVTKATMEIKKAIDSNKKISSEFFKKYDKKDLKKAFQMVSTPNIADAMHTKGVIKDLQPVKHGFHIAGRVLTVKTMDGDWAKPVEAIDKAEKDQIIVIDVNGGKTAVWGELATHSAKTKHIQGVIVNGAVRDMDDLLKINFPIFTKHVTSNAGEPKGYGEIGSEINIGGQSIRNNDWVIADDSGIIVVPQEHAQEIANRALDVKERENRMREEIKKGGSLGKVLKLKKWEKKTG